MTVIGRAYNRKKIRLTLNLEIVKFPVFMLLGKPLAIHDLYSSFFYRVSMSGRILYQPWRRRSLDSGAMHVESENHYQA